MRNYIILNGMNSNNVTGLLIQELAPITKPKIRTQIEEINGRDGDIVTELGYSAYTKEISIGLYGSYNVDDVIKYFNSNKKGQVIFSNEADKYYNYEIFEQIDFDRLIRFKTATVKMHVQPFKYPVSETPAEIEAEYVTATGEDITLNDTTTVPLEIGLKGNTYQETTTGKNLIGVANGTGSSFNVNYTIEDGIITLNGSSTGYGSISAISLLPTNGNYTVSIIPISGTWSAGTIGVRGMTSGSQSWYVNVTYPNTTATKNLTVSADTNQIFWSTTAVFNNFKFKIQVESGTSVTDYEPYTNGASPNPDYPQEVQVVTGDNTIKVCNENIQDNDWAVGRYDGSATGTNVHLKITNGTIYQEGHTYTIQFKSTNSNYSGKNIYLQNSNSQVNMGGIVYDSTKEIYYLTKTLSSSEIAILRGSQVRLAVYVSQGVTTGDITNGMIFEGNTPTTEYIAHQEQEYEINLGTLELCKIGTYQDYLYKSGENWYKHKEIGKITLNGSENWGYRNNYSAFYIDNTTSKGTIAPVSNYFKGITSGITSNDNAILFNAFTLYLIYHALNGVVSDLQTWLGTHNTTVYYQLATPTEEQITNEDLITQLIAIDNPYAYDTQTNISQETNNKPFILDVSTLKKGSNEAVISNIGNIYSKPIINIKGAGIVGVYLNAMQRFSIDMTTYNNITIDTANMEAYDPNTSQLRNRQVTGSYDNFKMPHGNNYVKITGTFQEATIRRYTRWL